MDPFGVSRASVQPDHALITPDTHVVAPLVGWEKTSAVVHISPGLGARFTQFTAILDPGAASALPPAGVERFIYVLDGAVNLETRDAPEATLRAGGYCWVPGDMPHRILATGKARLVVFEKEYRVLPAAAIPKLVVGHENDVEASPFLGDPDARLTTLLPVEPAFDMAVNIFTYQPGASLPQVEVHVMEHGLLMLAGAGVYRLGERWYPVRIGDVIWMAPYCPQWFVAIGKTPARYIYYKDIHRDPLDV